MYKKRSLIAIAAAVLSFTVLFSACSSNKPGTAEQNEISEQSAKVLKDLLDMKMTIFIEQATDGLKAMVEKVNSNKDLAVHINLDVIVGGIDGENLVKVKFASGDYPELLAQINAQWIKLNLNNGVNFLDISDNWVKNFPDNIIKSNSCSINGKVIAQPFAGAQCWVMYYNKQVFSDLKLSIPKTWDQLLTISSKIKAAGIAPVYYAGKTTWSLNIIPVLTSTKDYIGSFNDYSQKYHENKIKNVDRKNYIDGIYKTKELVDKRYVNATFLSDTHPMAQEALIGGKTAMYAGLSSLAPRLADTYPDKYQNIGAFAIPVGDENTQYLCQEIGKVLTATDRIKDVNRAKELFDYLGSKEVQMAYFEKNPDLPVCNLISSSDLNLTPAQKDILDLKNSRNVKSEPGLTDEYNSGVDVPGGIAQILATKNYTPEDLMKEIDDGIAKTAKEANDPNWE